MKLNRFEFFLMNNPVRRYIQENYELPVLMDMLQPNQFSSVLEIGCGSGNGTRLIRKYFNPRQISAVDLDEKMIRVARESNQDRSVNFQVMDASSLDFPDNSFDAVFDFGIIHHIPNWKDCILELRRVLKNDGKLILEELSIDTFSGFPGRIWKTLLDHPYEEMFSTEEFVSSLKNAGFRIDGFKEFNPLGMIRHFSLVAR